MMSKYQLVSDYKHIKKYKESFNELAKLVFNLDFKEWYDKGCWNDNYICYSYIDGDKVIANASVNKMVVICNGKEYKAIQVGTVMTHPDYRHKGLAARLMNIIIEKYEKEYDFIYLFANDTVLDFYPKFGFEKVKESRFSLKTSDLKKQVLSKSTIRKLDSDNQADFELMKGFAAERIPVSSTFGVKNNDQLLLFYFIFVFNGATYYIEEEDTIVIVKQEENKLHIFDILSKESVDLVRILNHIVSANTQLMEFYFTPDSNSENIYTEIITGSDDTLFVRPFIKDMPRHLLFPLTSHA